jgi:glycosyltransferase involved in cell wall biosynthesis
MRNPRVSVVIPAYNPGAYLQEAIGSVFDQTYSDWELIVVDDGSDEDLSWLQQHSGIRFLRQPNLGVSIARNRGILHAQGELVAFLDNDDCWRATKLERQVATLDANTHAALCYTQFELIDSKGQVIGPGYGEEVDYYRMLSGYFGILLSSALIRRENLFLVGLFDPSYLAVQDLDLFLRLSRMFPSCYLDSVEVGYRLHGANASSNWTLGPELLNILSAHGDLGHASGDEAARTAVRQGTQAVKRLISRRAYDAARRSFHCHDMRSFSSYLWKSLAADPLDATRAMGTRALRRAGHRIS